MTTFAYDTEVVEDGSTIDLISIAIVADDGHVMDTLWSWGLAGVDR
ncbi:hypothetical protein ACFVWN_01185 [Nocardiopsis flavescens]